MNAQTNAVTTEAAAAAEATRVRRPRLEVLVERHAKAVAKLTELQATIIELSTEITSINALASVTVGSTVIISVGRGETATQKEGVVMGVKEDEDGAKTYKVQYGFGFDTDVAVVSGSRITLPKPAEAPAAAEAVAE